MKFLTVREMRASTAKLWESLDKEGEVIVTNHGKPVAILTPVDGEHLDESLRAIRSAKALKSLRVIQEASVRNGTSTMTMAEIVAEIKAYRRERRRK